MSLLLTSIVAGATAITGAAFVYRMIRPLEYPRIPSSIDDTKDAAFTAAEEHAKEIGAEIVRVHDSSMEPALPEGVFAIVADVPVKELKHWDVIAYLGSIRSGIVFSRYQNTRSGWLMVRNDTKHSFKSRDTRDMTRNNTPISPGMYRGKVVAYYDWATARHVS